VSGPADEHGVILRTVALTAAAFAPFGDVIECAGHAARSINAGTCLRYDDLATVDVAAHGGRPSISIFQAQPRALPLRLRLLERHPLSSQAFYPLQPAPFLVVVAADGDGPWTERIRVFTSSGVQGVNYRRATWHHPLIALGRPSSFLVVDRGGAGDNCEEITLGEPALLVAG
jgi:ureidoglycolate lyase